VAAGDDLGGLSRLRRRAVLIVDGTVRADGSFGKVSRLAA